MPSPFSSPPRSHGVRVAGLQDAAELLLPRNCALPAHAVCGRPADLELRLEGEPGAQGPELSTGAQPLFLQAAVAGMGDAPVEWTVIADADGVLSAVPSPAPPGWRPEAPVAPLAATPEALARHRSVLRSELAAQVALVERLGTRAGGLSGELPLAAIAAALEAGDVAAAARDLEHVDAVLTRWALHGPNAH